MGSYVVFMILLFWSIPWCLSILTHVEPGVPLTWKLLMAGTLVALAQPTSSFGQPFPHRALREGSQLGVCLDRGAQGPTETVYHLQPQRRGAGPAGRRGVSKYDPH